MSRATKKIQVMPYTLLVGQEQLKRALEIAYVTPRISGVLLSGQRGTGKSTAVRAFAYMALGALPVTLPINATEDRVVGGWKIDELMRGSPKIQTGLLEEAGKKGLLYIDEINLLDDHIVNIILDVTSTGILVVEREGQQREREVHFTLVGTMNPSEGGLRPQLLDRFGLMVDVVAEYDDAARMKILQTVLNYDEAVLQQKQGAQDGLARWLYEARSSDGERRVALKSARERLHKVELPKRMAALCVEVAKSFQVEGHRGDYVMALAARACAALDGAKQVTEAYLEEVAPLALQHRRPGILQTGTEFWSDADKNQVAEILHGKQSEP